MQGAAAAPRFCLIDQLAHQHPVAWLCRWLGVARSDYYAWPQRQKQPGSRAVENPVSTAEIQSLFQQHRGIYGSPRIHQELLAASRQVGRHRVARLMQHAGLRAKTRRTFRPCSNTLSAAAGVAANLQQQDFQLPAPNRCWAGDVTSIRRRVNVACWH
jgi:transposase InsO family protein